VVDSIGGVVGGAVVSGGAPVVVISGVVVGGAVVSGGAPVVVISGVVVGGLHVVGLRVVGGLQWAKAVP
jgi:hypothetical protein